VARYRRITAPIDRAGFTLLELLLVLSLLVFLAALSWPSVGLPLANQALRSAADDVRTAWTRARVSAMSSGHTYVFRYAPDGDHYTIECQVAPEASAEVSPLGFGTAEATAIEDATPLAEEWRLPEQIRFGGGQTAVDGRAEAASAAGNSMILDSELAFAEPIFFYPDGTTSTARVCLQNEYGRRMELSLRGLTGVVTVGRVQDAQP
jgi:prepilin-type N-terminal cleavage/methylation domain-containing protein